MNRIFLANLQRFYVFECGAVQLYQSLAKHTTDVELRKFLLKFSDIEQTHVDFWENTLKQFGQKPIQTMGYSNAILNQIAGHGIGFLHVPTMLLVGYYIETIAMRDYGYFIKRYQQHYPDLASDMWDLKAEEELHGLWLREKSEEILGHKV